MLKKVLGLLIAILMMMQPVSAIAAEVPDVIDGPEQTLDNTDNSLGENDNASPLGQQLTSGGEFTTFGGTSNVDYKVQYYLENINDSNYSRASSYDYSGTATAGTTITAQNKSITGATIVTPIPSMTLVKGSTNILSVYYTRNLYPLNYDMDGGTPQIPTEYLKYGATIFATTTIPTREGATFWRWSESAGSNGKYNNNKQMPIGGFTLYAKWTINSYTLSYDRNGGTGNLPGSQTKTYNSTVTLGTNTLIRSGYTPNGWNTQKDGKGEHYNNGITTFVLKKDTILYAEWTPVPYNIIYNLDGGTNNSLNPNTYTIEDRVELREPTKPNYTFAGWSNGGVIPVGSTGDKTFTASWTINSYPVTFTAGANGSLSGAATSINVAHGTLWGTISVPTPTGDTGYKWDKWSPEFPKDTDAITGELSFTAQFVPIRYNISYDLVGGTNNEANPDSYTIEDRVELLPPTKTGHTFAGWLEGSIISAGTTGEKTFTASWTINRYTLSYDGNGATGDAPASVTEDYNTPVTVAGKGTLVKTGHSFKGWKDSNGTPYSGEFNLISDIKLYAQWEEDTYTLSYNANGGTGALPSAVGGYKHGATVSSFAAKPASLKKTGYTFLGWGTSSNSGVVSSVTFDYSSITLFAQWKIITYTVTFHGRNGDKWSQPVDHGNSAKAPATNIYDGYRFVSWSRSYTNVTKNLDVYGIWLPIPYTISYHDVSGALNLNPLLYTIDTTPITLNDPYKWGYVFTGWTTTGVTTPTKGLKIAKDSTGNRSFTAHWEVDSDHDGVADKDEFRVIYDGNGNDNGMAPVDNKLYSGGSGQNTFTAKQQGSLLKTGYRFLGWNTDKNADVASLEAGDTGSIPVSNANVELYAIWVAIDYDINYNLGLPTGATIEVGNPLSYTYPSGFSVPMAPEMTGYTFLGWTSVELGITDPELNVLVLGSTQTGTVNLTANWELTKYDITYDLGVDGVNHADNPDHYYVTSDDIVLGAPTRDGYRFIEWQDENDDTVTGIPTGSTGGRNFTAVWVKTYTVTFLGLNGAPLGSQTVDEHGSAIAPTVPANADYRFDGWDTAFSDVTSNLTVRGIFTFIEIPLNPTTPTPELTTIPENPVPGAPSPAPRRTTPTPAAPAAPVTPAPSAPPSAPPTQAPVVTTPAPQQTQEVVDIPDEEVPLSAQPDGKDLLTLVNLIAMIVTVIGAIVLAFKKFGKKDDEAGKEQKEGAFKRVGTKVIAAVAAVGGIVFFFLTEPLTPMDIWDKWSIWQLLILAVYAVMAIVAYSKKKGQDKEQNAKA